MILVTVGTQLPFDRLIHAIDDIAPELGQPVFAQTGGGAYRPRNIAWEAHVGAAEFERRFAAASFVVAHAGIGTILMAQRNAKPLILFPREAGRGEHRNDHQLATVEALAGRPGIYVTRTEAALRAMLMEPLLPPVFSESQEPRRRLLAAVAGFIAR